jgi:hypothetical protein
MELGILHLEVFAKACNRQYDVHSRSDCAMMIWIGGWDNGGKDGQTRGDEYKFRV